MFVFRNVVDFPKYLSIAIETFLFHCCDNEADIRLKADECLNRTVKVGSNPVCLLATIAAACTELVLHRIITS